MLPLPLGIIPVYTNFVNNSKRWSIAPVISETAKKELAVFPLILQQLLFNRGYCVEDSARSFLNGRVDFDTSPFQLSGMHEAVDRILLARNKGEPVMIYGDYDVDGVTATALLVQTLKALGLNVSGYIPNRFEEGYGLNNDALTTLKAEGTGLVISVDCGIRSMDEAIHAKNIGLDLIITDHHQPGTEIPLAFAVINPKQTGDKYPDKDLAGVGVAFKIAQALIETCIKNGQEVNLDPADLLDLVALGTVADLAPLIGENRLLVRSGLKSIRLSKRQGLFALANVSDLDITKTTAVNIGFTLGPRLNAAGRIESALAAFELLTTQDISQAGILAQSLNNNNRKRQEITRDIQQKAEELAMSEDQDPNILFAVDREFNSGVVGLAASRLSELHYRPAVVGEMGDETTRCSCRSIPEFHITQALDQCADLLVRHGGHAAAAGFTVKNKNLPELKNRLKLIAGEVLNAIVLQPTLSADIVLSLSDLTPDLLKHIGFLQPTGYGNTDAVFVSRELQVKSSRTVGADAKHLKIVLTDGKSTFDAIGFRLGHLAKELSGRVDIMYTFETNQFNGRTTLQLNLKDLKKTGDPEAGG